ncbi:hypothetical protein HYH03_002328 [Edaphochlamys debaryana]|uniref:AP2/ERF domain-containing protein n=1 Tax=Edaphochlamys debaryana TaxID=47281 RepID=A0A835YF31_9CHLO|nr:hypothetical protein HYH03_002328 [Edaphochlamys debaryana]|eukprot:KAG2500048.1 hypothetical protein HYH03_002328 [Edaphochlamys debaryana]
MPAKPTRRKTGSAGEGAAGPSSAPQPRRRVTFRDEVGGELESQPPATDARKRTAGDDPCQIQALQRRRLVSSAAPDRCRLSAPSTGGAAAAAMAAAAAAVAAAAATAAAIFRPRTSQAPAPAPARPDAAAPPPAQAENDKGGSPKAGEEGPSPVETEALQREVAQLRQALASKQQAADTAAAELRSQLAAAQMRAAAAQVEVAKLKDACAREQHLTREHKRRADSQQLQATAAQFKAGELAVAAAVLGPRVKAAERAAAAAKQEAAQQRAEAQAAQAALRQTEQRLQQAEAGQRAAEAAAAGLRSELEAAHGGEAAARQKLRQQREEANASAAKLRADLQASQAREAALLQELRRQKVEAEAAAAKLQAEVDEVRAQASAAAPREQAQAAEPSTARPTAAAGGRVGVTAHELATQRQLEAARQQVAAAQRAREEAERARQQAEGTAAALRQTLSRELGNMRLQRMEMTAVHLAGMQEAQRRQHQAEERAQAAEAEAAALRQTLGRELEAMRKEVTELGEAHGALHPEGPGLATPQHLERGREREPKRRRRGSTSEDSDPGPGAATDAAAGEADAPGSTRGEEGVVQQLARLLEQKHQLLSRLQAAGAQVVLPGVVPGAAETPGQAHGAPEPPQGPTHADEAAASPMQGTPRGAVVPVQLLPHPGTQPAAPAPAPAPAPAALAAGVRRLGPRTRVLGRLRRAGEAVSPLAASDGGPRDTGPVLNSRCRAAGVLPDHIAGSYAAGDSPAAAEGPAAPSCDAAKGVATSGPYAPNDAFHSRFWGVVQVRNGRFRAQLRRNRRRARYLGLFGREEEAARAFDCAAVQRYNARESDVLQLNFPSEWSEPHTRPVVSLVPETAAGACGAAPPVATPGTAGTGRGSEEGSGPQPMEGLEGGSGAQAQASLGPSAAGGAGGAQDCCAPGPERTVHGSEVQALAAGTRELPLGVTLRAGGRFEACIRAQGRSRFLGRYLTPEEAARAFDRAAVQRHNEGLSSRQLKLNFPSEWSNPAQGGPVVAVAGRTPSEERGQGTGSLAGDWTHAADERGGEGGGTGTKDEAKAGGAPGPYHACLSLSGLPRGVARMQSGRYKATMGKDGENRYLGTWDTPEQAGRAFDRAAVERYKAREGDNLHLNFPSEWSDPAQGPVVPRVQPAQGGGPGEAGAQPGAAPRAADSGGGCEEGSGSQPMEGLEGGSGEGGEAALGSPAAGGASGAQAPGGQGPAVPMESNGAHVAAAAGARELPLGVQRTPGGRFQAVIGVQGKQVYLGRFDTPLEAARAFDRAAVHRHNEGLSSRKLQLNFPADWSDPAQGPVVPRAPQPTAGGSGAAPPAAAPGAAGSGRGSEEGSGPQPMEGVDVDGGSEAQAQAARLRSAALADAGLGAAAAGGPAGLEGSSEAAFPESSA